MMILNDLETGIKGEIAKALHTCKRFADNDFQEVVFSFQTPKTNDKVDIRAF